MATPKETIHQKWLETDQIGIKIAFSKRLEELAKADDKILRLMAEAFFLTTYGISIPMGEDPNIFFDTQGEKTLEDMLNDKTSLLSQEVISEILGLELGGGCPMSSIVMKKIGMHSFHMCKKIIDIEDSVFENMKAEILKFSINEQEVAWNLLLIQTMEEIRHREIELSLDLLFKIGLEAPEFPIPEVDSQRWALD